MLVLFPNPVLAATLSVPAQYSTIQDAVDDASDGDTIEVAAGEYEEEVVVDGVDLTLVGLGGSTQVRIAEARPLEIVDCTVILSGFELEADERGIDIDNAVVTATDLWVHGVGDEGNGGGARIRDSQVSIDQSVFEDNDVEPADGGHLWADNATVLLSDVRFEQGAAGDGGAVYVRGGTDLTVTACTFDDNEADGVGGGLYLASGTTASIATSVIVDNLGNDDAGGLYADVGSLTLDGVTFEANRVQGNGVGIAAFVDGADVVSTGTTVLDHQSAQNTGGIELTAGGSWDGVGDVFTDNSTNGDGGAFHVAGGASLTLTGAVFSGNAAMDGGAIAHQSSGDLVLDQCDLSDNDATGAGGAIYWDGDDLSVTDSTVASNDANGDGGGLHLRGAVVQLDGNHISGNAGDAGGGVRLDDVASVVATWNVLCGNFAAGDGGGLQSSGSGSAGWSLTNNVLADNVALGDGGGARFLGGADPVLVNNTLLGNAAVEGGGIYFDGIGFTLNNTVVAGHEGNGVSADAGITGRSYALTYGAWDANSVADLGDGLAGQSLDATHLVAPPALMWTPDSCGVATYKPFPTSPVIDRGDPAISDPDASVSDIGAFGGPSVDPDLYADLDVDGFPGIFDCNDDDVTVFPGATEVCDAIDADCDGSLNDPESLDATPFFADVDGDGLGDATVAVSACVQPDDFVSDNTDCDDGDDSVGGPVSWYFDADQDGFGDPTLSVTACAPPAGYVADDTDCDDGDSTLTVPIGWFADVDGDGFGDVSDLVLACFAPSGRVADSSDCDDGNPLVSPAELESCNGIDDDCDSLTDEGDAVDAISWFEDDDDDGWGDSALSVVACTAPSGHVDLGGDCNDADDTIYPFAPEVCSSGVDSNCDGFVGNSDNDNDGTVACDDCDDGDAAIFPGADERCDDADNDCDGIVDEADAIDTVLSFRDQDNDGYGDPTQSVVACDVPFGFTARGDDCDDGNALVNPGGTDVCGDSTDYNCDGSVGSADVDLDGVQACDDCDDADAARFPGADELCDGIDNDCDAELDEDGDLFGSSWYVDADGDGFGDASTEAMACEQPAGRVDDATDCDDEDDTINPDADDVLDDGIDQDCDGMDAVSPDDTDVPVGDDDDDDDDDGPTDTGGRQADIGDAELKAKNGGCSCDANPTPVSMAWLAVLALSVSRRRS